MDLGLNSGHGRLPLSVSAPQFNPSSRQDSPTIRWAVDTDLRLVFHAKPEPATKTGSDDLIHGTTTSLN